MYPIFTEIELAEPAANDGAAAKENSTENAKDLVRKFDLIFLPAKFANRRGSLYTADINSASPNVHGWLMSEKTLQTLTLTCQQYSERVTSALRPMNPSSARCQWVISCSPNCQHKKYLNSPFRAGKSIRPSFIFLR